MTDTARHFGTEQAAVVKDELPAWLRTKPRTARGKREAAQWAVDQGRHLPWGEWRDWL